MNKVISREYVEKNYIHKDILKTILEESKKKSNGDTIKELVLIELRIKNLLEDK